MYRCFFAIALILAITGCTTYQSEGMLNIEDQSEFSYKHAAISPETDNRVRSALSKALKRKGFTVYKTTAYRNVVGIKQGNQVAVFICNDIGRTDRGLGSWSQAVKCIGYDLHTSEIIYEGIGEYMGVTSAYDYKGATYEALKRLPKIGDQGKITSIVELPHKERKIKGSYRERTIGKRLSSQGTGWMMPKGYVVTNYHVIEGAQEIKIIAYDGTEHIAKIYREDKINDIALLDIEDENIVYPAIPISNESASMGYDVFTIGYPLAGIMGTEAKFTSGKINSTSGIQNDFRVYQISVPVQAGNSGGPLLNARGEAVGIITSKLHAVSIFEWTGDLPQNVNYAIKAFYIAPLAGEYTKKKVAILPSTLDSYEELVHRIEKSIFMIIAK